MIDFDTFTKIPKECERFGQIKCCQKHLKVGQSPINCQIWSHWPQPLPLIVLYTTNYLRNTLKATGAKIDFSRFPNDFKPMLIYRKKLRPTPAGISHQKQSKLKSNE